MEKSKKGDIIAILIKIEEYLNKYLSEKWLKIFFFPVFILYILLIILRVRNSNINRISKKAPWW